VARACFVFFTRDARAARDAIVITVFILTPPSPHSPLIHMKAEVKIIVACGRGGEIGTGDQLPWKTHFKEDMQSFRDLTMGEGVVMGRRTWESLPERHRPLRGRRNYVLTRSPELHFPLVDMNSEPRMQSVAVMTSLLAAIECATRDGIRVLWVIGGSEVFDAALPLASEVVLTTIDASYGADAKVSFPLGALAAGFTKIQSMGPFIDTGEDTPEYIISTWRKRG
jgi:dihydrofolate reductase